ncbi:heme biosynthesis HemY N-terminal domain-containing protein [Vibrio tapetis subsp. quintayensis]|uniref:heme biosynthesis HemY N-terminal domain-containing protein n=1 Tax=Vibrio tapetis TaxID=52443 RepID=UPI0025B28D36|nr:heme biosynthesis HemY N-terminal domain-containing protein [Vibrio tapetis]MDN3680156.1 heme biosynthesis HemY N-terminal domain-containing protein [Vibrio tapetis subsp. quintayensis]
MIRLIILFILIGAGLYAGTQFSGQQGYVLISIANKTIEMSVTTLVLAIVVLLAALFGLEYLIKKVLRASSATWNWFGVRKLKRARKDTNDGMVLLLEGDWLGAEKKVLRSAKHHDMPLLCYLIASEAAQGSGNRAKRDQYLELASEQQDSKLAVALTRAKLLVADGQYDLALVTLDELQSDNPDNPITLELLKVTYQNLGKWQLLTQLLPKLKKAKLIAQQEFDQLNLAAQGGAMKEISEQQGSEGLLAHWNRLPRKTKQEPKLILCLVKQLIARKADSQAYIVVRDSLKKYQSDELYHVIAEMNLPDIHPAIVLLQAALQKDGNNAAAHSTLAQLLMRQEKWPEAQQHLEDALKQRPHVSDYAYLADVLEKQQLTQAANDVSRKALALVEAK